jgi:hypothetical protein
MPGLFLGIFRRISNFRREVFFIQEKGCGGNDKLNIDF